MRRLITHLNGGSQPRARDTSCRPSPGGTARPPVLTPRVIHPFRHPLVTRASTLFSAGSARRTVHGLSRGLKHEWRGQNAKACEKGAATAHSKNTAIFQRRAENLTHVGVALRVAVMIAVSGFVHLGRETQTPLYACVHSLSSKVTIRDSVFPLHRNTGLQTPAKID